MNDAWKADADRYFYPALGRYIINHHEDDGMTLGVLSCFVSSQLDSFRYAIGEDHYLKSPIEAALFAYFLFATNGYNAVGWDSAPGMYPDPDFATIFRTQERIGKYTADFIFEAHCRGHKRSLIVECDGHDFHEKTKQQAQHDKSRDRALTATGAQVLRFTGSEIYRDAAACVEEVQSHLTRIIEEAMADAGVMQRRKRA